MTTAEALTLAIMYTDQRRPNWEAQAVSEALAALRDRLKEEEEFRDAAMEDYRLDVEGGSRAVTVGMVDARRKAVAAYRRLVALRAVSKETPGSGNQGGGTPE